MAIVSLCRGIDMTETILTFDSSLKEEILGFFDKEVNTEGVIVEKFNPKQSVLSVDGQEVKIEEFGGIRKGSEVFIKNDLISLMRLSKQ
ncbi:hypothetical protein J4481_01375 [Candidatus Pacearchaeota archaeon]|nr:hypothetical protein [Candidatus Pacearchaeota archaeon]